MKMLMSIVLLMLLVSCGGTDDCTGTSSVSQHPAYQNKAHSTHAALCYGCHELRNVTVFSDDGKLKKSGKEATIANISKLLRTMGSHPVIFAEKALTQELEAAAAHLLYGSR